LISVTRYLPLVAGKAPFRAGEQVRRVVRADAGPADDPARPVGRRHEQQEAAVLDVSGDDHPAGHHQRVIGVGRVVIPAARHAGRPVPVHDLVPGDVDHADDRVILFGRDDVLAVRREERVVRHQKALAVGEITAARELPPDPAVRVDDEQAVVLVVSDQDVTGQYRRVGMRRQLAPAVGAPQPGPAGQDRAAGPGTADGGGAGGRPELGDRGYLPQAVVAADQVGDTR
jgi:hypothetical protein